VYKYLNGDEETRLFSVVPSDRSRGNGRNLKCMKLHLNTKNPTFYSGGDQTLTQVSQIGFEVSLFGNIKKPSGHDPGQLAMGGPA